MKIRAKDISVGSIVDGRKVLHIFRHGRRVMIQYAYRVIDDYHSEGGRVLWCYQRLLPIHSYDVNKLVELEVTP